MFARARASAAASAAGSRGFRLLYTVLRRMANMLSVKRQNAAGSMSVGISARRVRSTTSESTSGCG